MGAVATFDPARFVLRYPEFAEADPEVLALCFAEATLYLANDGSGPVSDAGAQLTLLNMLTAHIAKLSGVCAGPNGTTAGPAALVGRVSSASEGSVSVSTDAGGLPGSAAWFAQSSYGFAFWQATAPYRRGRYVPGPATTQASPWGPWGYPVGAGIRGW